MTPRARVLAAAAGQAPDRVPVVPMIREFAMRQHGLTFADCYRDPAAYVEAQLACREAMGVDALWDLFGIAALEEAAGAVLATPEDDPPTITVPALPERRLDRLRRIDPVGDGRMPWLLDIVRALRRAAGPDVPIFAWASAPFRSACMLRGLANLFLDMRDDPGFVAALVEACVEPCAAFGRALAEAGADVVTIGNASASSGMISREAYARFVHPSSRAMIAALRETGAVTMLHICGDLDDRADLALAEGMDILSFERLDVRRWKAGAATAFLGYVGTATTLLRGSPDDVRAESVRCIREAGPGGGFLLSGDCVVPRDTPRANVRAMVEAAARHGRYPLPGLAPTIREEEPTPAVLAPAAPTPPAAGALRGSPPTPAPAAGDAPLARAVVEGDASTTSDLIRRALEAGDRPERLLERALIPAMAVVGERFSRRELFVPEMLLAARAMQAALALLGPRLAAGASGHRGKVVIGTVRGDLHDIGKNLVATMLEGAGFAVVDLGADVAPERFVAAVRAEEPAFVMMSALLTTTMPAMRETIAALAAAGLRDRVRVAVGGAPVTPAFAEAIGADLYAGDAAEAVARASGLLAR